MEKTTPPKILATRISPLALFIGLMFSQFVIAENIQQQTATDEESDLSTINAQTSEKSIERVQVISRKYDGLTNITEDTKKACNYARCRR